MSEPIHINQIELVAAIAKELERQHKKQKRHAYAEPRLFNRVIAAANSIVDEYAREVPQFKPGMGFVAWHQSDETGQSSLAMAYAFGKATQRSSPDPRRHHLEPWPTPRDPSDLRRCIQFRQAVELGLPGGQVEWMAIAQLSPTWALFVADWETLEQLAYTSEACQDKEKQKSLFQSLYERIQRLNGEEPGS